MATSSHTGCLFRFNTRTNFKIPLNSVLTSSSYDEAPPYDNPIHIITQQKSTTQFQRNRNNITKKKKRRHFGFCWSILSPSFFFVFARFVDVTNWVHIPKPDAWCTCMHSKQWIFCEVVHSRKHLESIPTYQFSI